jgi:hypothetical protein
VVGGSAVRGSCVYLQHAEHVVDERQHDEYKQSGKGAVQIKQIAEKDDGTGGV